MDAILYKTSSNVCTITLNRPQVGNAVDEKMLSDLSAALKSALANKDIKVIILTGIGHIFCSGANLTGDTPPDEPAPVEKFIKETVNPLVIGLRQASKPIVVAVNGPAIGFGMALALAGDIIIAAHSASFSLAFVNVGAALDGGSSLLTGLSIGGARARAMALLGERIDAQSAMEWGLVWKVVNDDILTQEAEKIAEKLGRAPIGSIGLIKSQLYTAQESQLPSVLENEAVMQGTAFAAPAFQAALKAFKAKRKPDY